MSILDRHKYRIVRTNNQYISYRNTIYCTWLDKDEDRLYNIEEFGIVVAYVGII